MLYSTIAIDSPWQYNDWPGRTAKEKRARGIMHAHYSGMSYEALSLLPIRDIAAQDCVLFSWSVWPHLPEALALGQAWGFRYITCAFVWVKNSKTNTKRHVGQGRWTQSNTEFCLLFKRGKPARMARTVRQLIEAPITTHSAKPQEFYERVEALTQGPYLEIFARARRSGWDSVGNEIDGKDIFDALIDLRAA